MKNLFRVIVAILAATLAQQAVAGPVAIVGALLGAAAGAVAVTTGIIAAVSLTTAVIAGAVIGAVTGKLVSNAFTVPTGAPSADTAASYASGLTGTQQGPDAYIPVIYGRRRLGGSLVYMGARGDRNQYLYQVIVLCEGVIDGPERIYIDDELMWTGTATHGATFTPTTGNALKRKHTTMQWFDGRDDQTVSTIMRDECGWNSNDRLQGLSYIVLKTFYPEIKSQEDQDNNPWTGIPQLSLIVRGRRVYNSWSSLNVNSPPAYSSTGTWTTNPVSCLLDYLRNPRYGKGLENSEIDWDSWKRAAIGWVTDNNGNAISQDKQHQCHAAVFTDRTIFDNVNNFLYNMRACMPYQQGKYKLRVEDNGGANGIWDVASTSVYTFNVDNIIGDVTIQSDSTSTRLNQIVINYPGSNEGLDATYEFVDLVYPSSGSSLETTTLAEDNGRINSTRMTFEHITDATTATYMAQLIFNLNRHKGKSITFTADSSAHNVEIMDIVTVVYPGLGINGKFRVRTIDINQDYTFQLGLTEHEDQNYAIPIKKYNPVRAPVIGYVGATLPPTIDSNGIISNSYADIYLPSTVPNVSLQGAVFAEFICDASSLKAYDVIYPYMRTQPVTDPEIQSIDLYIKRVGDTEWWFGGGRDPVTSAQGFNINYVPGFVHGAQYQIRVQASAVRSGVGVVKIGPEDIITFTTPQKPVPTGAPTGF